MMHPTDHGAVVICGDWRQVNEYIVKHGLDPNRVIRQPSMPAQGVYLNEDQVVLLPGWEPDYDDANWFWGYVMASVLETDDLETLTERARSIPGLVGTWKDTA